MEDFDEPMSPVLMDKKWVFNEGKRATTANDEQKHNLLLQPTEAQKETGLLSERKALDSNQRYKHSEVTPVNSSSAICKIKNKNPELNPSPDMKVRSQFSEGKTVLSLDEQTPTSSRNSFSRNISLLDLDDSVEKNFLSKCRDLTNNFQSGSPHIQKYSVKQLENDKHSIFKPSNKFESSILNNSNEEYFLTSSGYKPSSSVKLDSPVGFSPTKRTLEVNVCTKFQANEKTESNTEDNTVSTNDKRHFPDMIFEEDNHLQDSNREDEKEEIINKSRNLFLSEVYESPVNSSQLVYTKKESPEKHSEKNDQYMKTSAEVEQISNPAFLTLGGTVVNMSQNCTKTMSEDINDESDFIDVEGVDSSDEPDGYLKERLKLVKEINADEDNYPTCSSDLNPVTRRFSSVNDKSCRNSTCKDNLKNNRDTALKDHFIDFNLAAFSQADISLETYSSESGKVLNPLQVCRNTSSMTSDDFSGSDVSQVPSEFIETEIVMPESEGSEGYSRLPDLTLIARDKENDEGEITIVESMISDDPVDSWSLNLEDSSKTEMGASSTTGGILKNQNKEINNFSQFAKNNMQFCAREENSVHFSKCIDKQDRLSSKFVEHSNDIQIESSEERFTFSTAGGKSVEISESRLARARKLFAEDFDDGKEIDSISTLETGKFKQISADSSDKMNLLFSHQIPEEQVSFSNGSGINVTISQRRDEARDEKRKKIYVEDNGKNNQISTSSENNEVLEKSFKISEKSSQEIEDLNKKHSTVDNNGLSTRILASSEMDKPEKLQIYKEETLDATSEKNGLIGENKVFAQDSDKETKNIIPGIYFSTALGKEVKSESSLVKAKNLCELDLEENFKLLASAESSVFSTASGKEIKLSEKSLAKAKKLFEQDLDENLKLSIPPESSVFSTATGKEIKLSEKSLAKAKKLFGQDLDENLETSQLLTAGSPLCSPQKGPLCSKKSDDNCATSTTEILYSVASTKEGYSLKGNNQTQETSSSLGFSTASGKQIFVSEKSLVKAMKLFTEEMNDCSASSVIKELRGSIRKPFSGLENKSTSMGTAHLAINNVDKTGCEKVEQNVQKCEAGDKTVENPDVDLEPGFFHEFSKHVFPQESCFSTGSHTKKSCVYNSFSAQEKSNKISYKTAAERKEYLPSDSKIKNTENEKNVELDADLDKELSECNIIKSNKRKLIHDENTPISNSNFNYKRSLVRNNIEKLPSKMNIAKRFEIGTPERTIGIEKKAKISEKEVKFCDDIPVGPLKYENKLPRLISTNSNDNNSTVKVETEIELLGAKKCQLTSSQMSEVSECTLAFMELADEFGVDNAGNTTNDTTLAKRKSTEQETWDSKICKKLKYEHDNHDSEIEKRFRAYSDAKKRQVETIEMKKKCKVKPQTGSLFLSKEKQERKQLSDALGENIARLYTREELLTVGVNNDILDLTSLNAHEFRFNVQRFCEGEYEIQMDDGIILVPDLNNEMGLTEIKDCFLASPGVDPSLVPVNWVENHYRWIVWKLCSFERTFPKQFSGRCLNVENVLLQLKYRYDKEIDKAQRPALRKILERDEQPGRTFICCVASIKKTDFDKEGHRLELEITDGWYSVFTLVDPEMVELVRSNKVKIGTKLIVHGAELLNCDDGCDPLNVPQEVKLQIHTNSVRRVRWYSKMGFFRNPGPIVVGLNSILPNGGLIGLTTGVVARVYPLLFMSKDTEGKTVLRNDRMQSIEEAKQNELCGKKVEAIYENVWKEVEEKYVPKSLAKEVNLKNIKNIDDPKSLYAIYKMTADESLFSPEQLTTVTAHHEEVTAKIRSEVDESVKKQLGGEQQNIKRMKKVKIVDYFTGCPFCLTIWQPTEEVLALIDECKTLDLYGLSASGVRDNMIQLSTTRQTRFVENNCLQSVSKYKRKITKLSEFASDNFSPLFGEVEVIGVVIYVTKPDQTHGVTKVYLSDLESNYLAITFWSSLSKFGWEEILEEGSLVAGSNLQWRIGSRSSTIPCVYATEMSLFSQNPKQLYFKQEITEFNLFSIEKSLTEFAEDEKMKLLNIIKHPESTLQSPSTVHLNLSNLKSPSALCQKRARLSNQYGGQVLPLSPMALANNHPNVRKEFISPFRTKK
ncbi:breast cancer type 2 susceptibility protein-like isoform X2 [Cimex lectularius]|uniref:Breast cancer type 2 susceptibility protein homolog n=1 Tax=Cimex lectularius TaxID=79782 RepID=A0A8I6SLW8_CIMLE|nr:breast cancer type 2 susceptibility protein-like isoform X2 [Cimex lectularius]